MIRRAKDAGKDADGKDAGRDATVDRPIHEVNTGSLSALHRPAAQQACHMYLLFF